jgi:hypothetical protein
MKKPKLWLLAIAITLAAFLAGRWSNSNTSVRADSGASPQIEVRPIGGDSSLTVYYPNLNKLFVYQNPFVGLPKWNCSYSIQLSEPGGQIERKPCSNPGQLF